MKIVILESYPVNPGDLSWDCLKPFGEVMIFETSSLHDEAQTIARIGDAEIVLTNKVPITRRVMDACPRLQFIGVLATGYNVIDCACAKEKGILVSNVPAYGTAAVAQFTIGLLLEICSHIGHHDESVHAGVWQNGEKWCYWDQPLIELAGKTMGIIGFGRIGQAVGRIAKALGMRVLACGSHPTEAGRKIADYVDLETLLSASDVVSLHCPLFPETRELINCRTIEKMKDGVILLNTGRGPLIAEQDLADALNSGKVRAAAMDVVSTEPISGDNPLLKARNCILTPHIAWAPIECRQRIIDCTRDNIQAYLEGSPIHVVNG